MWNGVDALGGQAAEDAGMHTTTTKENPGRRRAPKLIRTGEVRRKDGGGERRAPFSGGRGKRARACGHAGHPA